MVYVGKEKLSSLFDRFLHQKLYWQGLFDTNNGFDELKTLEEVKGARKLKNVWVGGNKR